MPQLDKYHSVVRNALLKAGWTITHDPLYLRLDDIRVFIDLTAERINVQPIAIEVKVLESPGQSHQIASAFGQYLIYRAVLELERPNHKLYLAVPAEAYYNLLVGPTFQKVIEDNQIYLVVFQPEREEIVLWTN